VRALGVVEADPVINNPFGLEAVGNFMEVNGLLFQRSYKLCSLDQVNGRQAMKLGSNIQKLGGILMISGALLIVIIFLSVILSGSWDQSPEIVQAWGNFIRSIANIPILGNFLSFIIWLVVFVGPGYLLQFLGKKITERENESR
jgi:hypothetical protein